MPFTAKSIRRMRLRAPSPNMEEHYFADPDPPERKEGPEFLDYLKTIDDYSNKMLIDINDSDPRGERAWLRFTSMFRNSTILHMNPTQSSNWYKILEARGVKVLSQPRVSIVNALADCRNSSQFPGHPVVQTKKNPPDIAQDTHYSFRTNDPSSSINALSAAYTYRAKYNGDYDFEPFRLIFDILCKSLLVTKGEKVRAVPLMLEGIPLLVFGSRFQGKEAAYEEIVQFYYTVPLHLWKKPLDFVLRSLLPATEKYSKSTIIAKVEPGKVSTRPAQ